MRNKLDSIQFARAVAALMVLLAHLSKEMIHRAPSIYSDPLSIWNFGQAGVDLFFVVSGFIMVYVSDATVGTKSSSGVFLKKRLARVVPLYWIFTTLVLLIAIFAPNMRNQSDSQFAYAFKSYLFFPSERPTDSEVTPIYALGWTLNYEMYFYVCFALLLQLPRALFKKVLVAYFLTAVSLGLVVPLRDFSPALWYWTRPVVLEFVAGSVIGMLYLRGFRISNASGFWLVTFALLWFFIVGATFPLPGLNTRVLVWGVPAALLLGSLVFAEKNLYSVMPQWGQALTTKIGDSSYSLYLSHMFVIRITTFLLPVSKIGVSYVLFYPIITILICLLVARLSYQYLELTTGKLFRRTQ